MSIDAELSRTMRSGKWTIVPSVSIGIARSVRDGFTDSGGTTVLKNSETFATGDAEIDFSSAYGISWDSVKNATFSGGFGLSYNGRSDRNFTSGASLDIGSVSGKIDAGTKMVYKNGSTLDLRMGANGLGVDTRSIFGAIMYSMKF